MLGQMIGQNERASMSNDALALTAAPMSGSQTHTIGVGGMHCASCVQRIEAAVSLKKILIARTVLGIASKATRA